MKYFCICFLLLTLLKQSTPQCLGFTCRDGQCLGHSFDRCDGVVECTDTSDEANCNVCRSGYYCDNTQCTELISDRCNDQCECNDCSDETNCFTEEAAANMSVTEPSGLERNVVVGIIIGCSIGGLVLLCCLPLTICITVVCVVVTAAKRKESHRRSNVRKEDSVAATGYHEDMTSESSGAPPTLQLEPVHDQQD